ncbi:hypothetical protein BLNAU_11659 [Blattamonas nauphoetae]|uniref:Uncharacterized protein n=1 Tax=Blattamonas nauphoetae TaxID=2049346 RepID=A0ABQ9XNP5_9EUKA|nr:hypothetical protein BLNAU_11659 [Blattamonas nauphoetae]
MLPEPQPKIAEMNNEDELNHPSMESVLELLTDPSVHPRSKVNSFQWSHIPTLLTNQIQSQQQQSEQAPPPEQSSQLLTQFLESLTKFLEVCFNSHTPIPNKRLLHPSLSQLAQSPSLNPSTKHQAKHCLISLDDSYEGQFVLIEKETLDSVERLQKDHDQLQVKFSESERKNRQLEDEKTTHLSTIKSLERERELLQRENERLRGESDKRVIEMQRMIEGVRDQLNSHIGRMGAKECIVDFSPEHFRVNGSTVTRINSDRPNRSKCHGVRKPQTVRKPQPA